jgi:pantothenate kinase-related protein Tda10
VDFDLSNLSIFNEFFSRRPEVTPDNLKRDLEHYYLPYIKKLLDLKTQKNSSEALIVGVSAIQGTGKTTQGEILEILFKHFGHSSDSRSIDDHYITHKELCELRNKDPRFIRRGVTHDIDLAISDLKAMQRMENGKPILISGYYKGAHMGDGDRFRWVNPEEGTVINANVVEENLIINKQERAARALKLTSVTHLYAPVALPNNMGSDIPIFGGFLPDELNGFLELHKDKEVTITLAEAGVVSFNGQWEIKVPKNSLPNGWRVVDKKPAFIFYDGWMLGARKVGDESIFDQGIPALESEEDKTFAKDVNKKLGDYESLWEMLDFLTVLYVVNYQISLNWRDQAEEVLRAKGQGMSHDQIREFVYYFWRSVHPGIHIKHLAYDSTHTNQVVIINDDHTVKEVLTPDEVKSKYP